MEVSFAAFPLARPHLQILSPEKIASGRGIPPHFHIHPTPPPARFPPRALSLTSIGDSQNLQEIRGRKSECSPGWILKEQSWDQSPDWSCVLFCREDRAGHSQPAHCLSRLCLGGPQVPSITCPFPVCWGPPVAPGSRRRLLGKPRCIAWWVDFESRYAFGQVTCLSPSAIRG